MSQEPSAEEQAIKLFYEMKCERWLSDGPVGVAERNDMIAFAVAFAAQAVAATAWHRDRVPGGERAQQPTASALAFANECRPDTLEDFAVCLDLFAAQVAAERAKPDATPHSTAAKIWYEQFDGKPQSPGWIIAAYDKAIAAAHRAGEIKGIEAMRELAGFIAINGCLVPPDGGSPTEDERELSAEIARRIYAATAPTSEPEGSQREGTLMNTRKSGRNSLRELYFSRQP